jgi:hypothetical protein
MTIIDDNTMTTADLTPSSPRSDETHASGVVWPTGGPIPAPVQVTAPATAPASVADGEKEAVFSADEVGQLRPMWNAIQAKFIDEPRKSVEEADVLVASTIQRLAESFTAERAKLESQWGKGDDVSTEDLRLALRRYRSFFDRLLSA